ncbi:MAG: hypothetical protein ABL927_02315 [Bdellovibrionales bacterium]
MKTIKLKILFSSSIYMMFALSIALISCARSKSDWLVSPDPVYQSYNETAGDPVIEFNPKAEIIFVIDNSASMSKHIARVSENIDRFVDSFAKNNPLEYNLAVVSVYDSRTFSSEKYKSQWAESGTTYKMGQFRNVKNSQNEIINDKYFISSNDSEIKQMLSHTLKVGVQKMEDGGPVIEESFSPVAAVYNFYKSMNSDKAMKDAAIAPNDFFMGDDSYKIIFFVTDATDASTITSSELYYNLVARSKGDRTKVLSFGAIVPSDANGCVRDPGNKAYKLEEFLSLTRISGDESNVVSLCGDFGNKFAAFGKSIRARVLGRTVALTNGVPVISDNPEETLRVFYGSQEIPMEEAAGIVGFKYNPRNNSIRINSNIQLVPEEGAKLRIHYKSVRPVNLRNNQIIRYEKK